MFKTSNIKKVDKNNNKGMTLLEIMIVVGIIGAISAIILPNIQKQREKSNIKLTKLKMSKVMSALEEFYSDCYQYPESLDQLINEPGEGVCENWGPDSYVKNEKALKDSWRNDFVYVNDDGNAELISLGKDKAEGGEKYGKDISSLDD